MKRLSVVLGSLIVVVVAFIFSFPINSYAAPNYDYQNDSTALFFPDITEDISNDVYIENKYSHRTGENNLVLCLCKRNVNAKNFEWAMYV